MRVEGVAGRGKEAALKERRWGRWMGSWEWVDSANVVLRRVMAAELALSLLLIERQGIPTFEVVGGA
jgi:hypothetical protein